MKLASVSIKRLMLVDPEQVWRPCGEAYPAIHLHEGQRNHSIPNIVDAGRSQQRLSSTLEASLTPYTPQSRAGLAQHRWSSQST